MIKALAPLATLVLIAIAGCDPGMTIRQAQSSETTVTSGSGNAQTVEVFVASERVLTGETWYNPKVTVTNLSDESITITGADLIAGAGTYASRPPGASSYPLDVAAGKAAPLAVWFDLSRPVSETFSQPARLHVRCRAGMRQFLATVTLESVR